MTKEQQAEQAQPQVNAAGDDVMVGVSSAVSLPVSSEISPAVSLEVSPVVSLEVSPGAEEVIVPTTAMAPEAPRPKAQPRTQPKPRPKPQPIAQAAIQQPAIHPEPVPEAPAEAPPVSAIPQQEEVAITVEVEASRPAAPPLPDPRRRLRELLAIPDRDRTDALWDELIELEIQLAPGNRAPGPNAHAHADVGRGQKPGRFAGQGRHQDSPNGAPRHGNRPDGAGPGANGTPGAPRPAKRFFKKARRGPRPPAKV